MTAPTGSDRAEMTGDGAGTATPGRRFDAVVDVLAAHAAERPDQPAVIWPGGECSYRELDRRVRAVAGGLADAGVGAGSVVGLLCANRPEWIVAALGTVAGGGTVAAFNTWAKQWDLDHLLIASGCEILVAAAGYGTVSLLPLIEELVPEAWGTSGSGWSSAAYPSLRQLVMIGASGQVPAATTFAELEGGEAPPRPLSGDARDAVALVLYTSGSTARPKAVPLQQGIALEHGYDVGVRMGVAAGDRIMLPVPLFWSYGGANALMVALAHGCTLVIQEVFDAGETIALVERHRCNVIYTLPNITAALLAHPEFTPERVRSLEKGMTIGSKADVAAATTGLGVAGICNAFGSTEIYGCCSATPHDWPLERKLASQGPPLPRVTVTVRDPASGQALAAGELGEICVSGQVTTGYLGYDNAAAGVFNDHGEYRSGDLGYLDADGNVVFAARATEMIKSAGINIAPAEIEEFLLTHPDIAAAVVTGVDDDARGQVAVAFVLPREQATLDEAEVKDFCRRNIASFKIPARILITRDAFPTTPTGKLARQVLRERAGEAWKEGRS
ncbi:MAG: class I adenylate-forming enzyme family protein [Acidimicrobiales bacterium]